MTEPASGHYEAYPYPPRDAADELRRLVTGSPSHVLEINHYIFAGRRDFLKSFRVLVAGGGTGDATIMLAQQFTDMGANAEIVHLDLSEASIDVARDRARMRNLTNIEFVHGSLLDVPDLELGTFDYIDCCGVLHHLEDPLLGLKALEEVLEDDGGMGLMLYAPLGRTGVYHMQAMIRMMGVNAAPPDKLELARRLLRTLPETNWLQRNQFVGDHTTLGDAGLFDLLLHRQDRPFSVMDIVQLMAGARLRLLNFIDPLRYEPVCYLKDPEIVNRVQRLPMLQRSAFAELLCGNMKTHVFYVVKAVNKERTVANPSAEAIPVLRDMDGPSIAQSVKPGGVLSTDFNGIKARFPTPPLTPTFFGLINGERPVGEILESAAGSADPATQPDEVKAQFDRFYLTLNGLSRMFLYQPPTSYMSRHV